MKKISPRAKEKLLRFLTILVFIYPMLPLLLVCFWAISVLGVSPLIELETISNIKLDTIINWFFLMTWLLGGIAGIIGLIKILSNKRTLTSLILIIYGAISYTIIAFFFIIGGILQTNSYLFFLHAIYVFITLCVIAIQITVTAKEVFRLKTQNKNNSFEDIL